MTESINDIRDVLAMWCLRAAHKVAAKPDFKDDILRANYAVLSREVDRVKGQP